MSDLQLNTRELVALLEASWAREDKLREARANWRQPELDPNTIVHGVNRYWRLIDLVNIALEHEKVQQETDKQLCGWLEVWKALGHPGECGDYAYVSALRRVKELLAEKNELQDRINHVYDYLLSVHSTMIADTVAQTLLNKLSTRGINPKKERL